MALKIEAPEVERRLRQEAAVLGVSAEAYVLELVSSRLPQDYPNGQAQADSAAGPIPGSLSAPDSVEQWLRNFDQWVDRHPSRSPLAPDAFSRASLYAGRP